MKTALSTNVYIASITPLLNEEVYRCAFDAATPERQEKAARFKRPEDRARSVGVEMLIKKALRDKGIDDKDIQYDYGAEGKPYIRGAKDFYFNVSHSGDYVMCAAAPCEVGCDVEKVEEANLKIAKRFYRPEEYERIAGIGSPEAMADMFYRYWTLKESFVKAVGDGLKIPLNSFCIVLGQDGPELINYEENCYEFQEIDSIPGYKGAVCLRQSEETPFNKQNLKISYVILAKMLQMM